MWIFQRSNQHKKYLRKNIRGRPKGDTLFQMIWECFSGNKLGPIIFVDRTVNADKYIKLLYQNLLSFLDACIADGATNVIFQHDNATLHTAKKTCDWLEIALKERKVRLMKWPPNSSDLNPIENLWAHLKLHLHRRFPDTEYLCGSLETIKCILRQRLMEVWSNTGENVLNRLIDSMPHCMQILLDAKSWYMDY